MHKCTRSSFKAPGLFSQAPSYEHIASTDCDQPGSFNYDFHDFTHWIFAYARRRSCKAKVIAVQHLYLSDCPHYFGLLFTEPYNLNAYSKVDITSRLLALRLPIFHHANKQTWRRFQINCLRGWSLLLQWCNELNRRYGFSTKWLNFNDAKWKTIFGQ